MHIAVAFPKEHFNASYWSYFAARFAALTSVSELANVLE